MCRLAKDMNNNKKIAMVNNFVNSNFNYSSFAWNFCSWLVFVENREKRYLRLVLDDHEKNYKNLIKKNDAYERTVFSFGKKTDSCFQQVQLRKNT